MLFKTDLKGKITEFASSIDTGQAAVAANQHKEIHDVIQMHR